MTKSKRKALEDGEHFILEADHMGSHVLRYVLRCKRCNKERTMAGGVKHIKWKCCNREYEKDLSPTGEE